MKLRNKKTGEIIELLAKPSFVKRNDDYLQSEVNTFNSLAELNAEWEDYKSDRERWYINENGGVLKYIPVDPNGEDLTYMGYQKEIGNYFETKEEAEKAVEKLKEYKRLKDKGFKFTKWTIPEEPKTKNIKLVIEAEMDVPDSPYCLDLLFGGEE